ncbi:MAG: sulfite exporter TauE/SafE family protein [Actinomycetes bacterium]
MSVDPGLAVAGLIVGFVVGLTGMGGGALMTPILIFFFKIDPLNAVGSDLVVSLFMKPVGAAVHWRRGTVNLDLVKWLCLGSVPFALLGVFIVDSFGNSDQVENGVKVALGIALLVSVLTMTVKAVISLRQHYRDKALGIEVEHSSVKAITIRPIPTVLIGALGGLVVGMTSVGSGSLIIVGLLLMYPLLRAGDLVGTDLVQAVPLVAAAALGHVLAGNFEAPVAFSLLIGAMPGVFMGSRVSSRGQSGLIRRALMLVLLASGLKLVGAAPAVILGALVAFVLFGPAIWALVRNTEGFTRRPHRVEGVHPMKLVLASATGVPPRYQRPRSDNEPAPAGAWDPEESAADPL